MIFLFVVFIAWILYFSGYRVFAYVLFFFFVTSEFQIIPEELMEKGFGFSKGTDYALVLLLGCLIVDSIFIKDYLKIDKFIQCFLVFFIFLTVCILYSKFIVHCTLTEIVRTSRFYLFLLTYFVFRNMTESELKRLLNILFTITVCMSCLYLLQIILGERILNGTMIGKVNIGSFTIKRFYNQPFTLHFFVLMAIYNNPYRGFFKITTTLILILALLGGFHRSLIGFFIVCLILGKILDMPRIRQIKVFAISLAIFIPAIAITGHKFINSRTYIDIQSVVKGEFVDASFNLGDLANSTFAFRMGHLWERVNFLSDSKVKQVLGAGLIPEDSKKVDNMFDFSIGLLEELSDRTIQLDTGDIAYSILIIRFGYLGTLLFLSIFVYMAVYFYKRKENPYAFFSFLYIILSFGVSFFSANLLMPITFILPILSMCLISKLNQKEKQEEKEELKVITSDM